MKTVLSALLCGLLFGAGLAVSGMMNPEKVLGFLDVAGAWDPTLAFVMGGALAVTIPGFVLLKKRAGPVFSPEFSFPTRRDIDPKLVIGAAIFGVGWGIVGFCPGPAVAALGSGMMEIVIFFAAMLGGMVIYRVTMDR